MTKTYNAKDIQVLEGLDAVRLRPGMYIGTTGPKGLHHLIWEIVDNAIDEAANKFCNRIIVTLNKDGSVTVEDNGRGIPVDIHPVLKKSAVEVVYTELHAGGKFNNENYAYSGGLHGVGASVVNALSKWCNVVVQRDGKKYEIKFALQKVGSKLKGGQVVQPLKEIGKSTTTGTTVTFLPDDSIFETIEFSADTVSKRLKELAFLNKGVEIVFVDARQGEEASIVKSYKYDGGLKDFVKYINEGKTAIYEEPIFFEGEQDNIKIEIAIQHTDSYTESVFSFVNNIPTTEGGTHEVGFKSGLTRVLNDLARKNGNLKEKDQNLMGEDFREGLTAVLSIKMKNIQFEGQTKTKLGNPEAKPAVEAVTVAELNKFFGLRGTGKTFSSIIDKALGAAKVREASRKAKEYARQKNSVENYTLVGKLAACSGKNYVNNELFIVEGDSAGGSAKQGRDRHFQAILPLRGKPLNAEKKRIDQVLANEEIKTIISALGTGIGDDFNLDNLRYHKVIILADADQDGAHIRAILATFFYRYMKELINQGHLYIGMPPLYLLKKRGKQEYVYSDAELPAAIERIGGKPYEIQRYKG
ncbi:MAG: DNA gyrase subunit B, partial [Clostridia bacterium]|nr:DNA gyrase subunit B [Clostridia bacterium]